MYQAYTCKGGGLLVFIVTLPLNIFISQTIFCFLKIPQLLPHWCLERCLCSRLAFCPFIFVCILHTKIVCILHTKIQLFLKRNNFLIQDELNTIWVICYSKYWIGGHPYPARNLLVISDFSTKDTILVFLCICLMTQPARLFQHSLYTSSFCKVQYDTWLTYFGIGKYLDTELGKKPVKDVKFKPAYKPFLQIQDNEKKTKQNTLPLTPQNKNHWGLGLVQMPLW